MKTEFLRRVDVRLTEPVQVLPLMVQSILINNRVFERPHIYALAHTLDVPLLFKDNGFAETDIKSVV